MPSAFLEVTGVSFVLTAAVAAGVARMAPKESLLRGVAELAAYVMLWYTVSIGLTLVNKYLFTFFDGGRFHFPLSMTALHLLLQFLTATVLTEARLWAPARFSLGERDVARLEAVRRHLLAWPRFLRVCVPVSLATAADIALSNVSVLHVPVAVYTIAKSSSLVFNLLLSVAMGLQRCQLLLVVVVVLIFMGVVFTAWREDDSDSGDLQIGVLAAVGAAAAGAVRWVFTEKLLHDARECLEAHNLVHDAPQSKDAGNAGAEGTQISFADDDDDAEEQIVFSSSGRNIELHQLRSDSDGERTGGGEEKRKRSGDEEDEAGEDGEGEEGEEDSLLRRGRGEGKRGGGGGGGGSGGSGGGGGGGKHSTVDPILLLSLVAPVSSAALVVPAAAMEGSGFFTSRVWTDETEGIVALIGVLGGGLVAFALIYAEMHVIARTSALTTTIIGHVKESLVIVLSILIYGDTVLPINVVGILCAVAGTALYIYLKDRARRAAAAAPALPPQSTPTAAART